MNPKHCDAIPSYMKDAACSIARAGRNGEMSPDLARPSIFTTDTKPVDTVSTSNIKDYTPGVALP